MCIQSERKGEGVQGDTERMVPREETGHVTMLPMLPLTTAKGTIVISKMLKMTEILSR